MKLKSYLQQALTSKAFAELRLVSGQRIRIPGERPELGAAVLALDADGNEQGSLPNGTYRTQNGYEIRVEDGEIVAVKPIGQSETTGFGALQHQLNQMSERLENQTEKLADAEAKLRQYEAGPGAEPTPKQPMQENFNLNTRYGHTTASADTGEIAEGIRMIRMAKAGHPEYQFNAMNAKRFSTGTGVNFNNLLARCNDIADDLFHLMVVEEGLAQHFNTLDVNVNGDASVTVELPTLDDSDTAYLKPGIDCTYTAEGSTVLNKREMSVAPWHYYREYCPKDWGNSFRGKAYVNDEELPYEAVVLEFLFGKIRAAWEQTIMTGDSSGTDPFDGLLTQVLADTSIPGAQQVNLDPTGANAVAEFETLLAAVPPHMFANVMDEPLLWFTPNQHLEYYVQNYRSTYQSLPYNNRFEKFGPDSALKRANFIHTAQLTDTHILTAKSNLFLGVGKDMDVDVQFHDSGKDQYLFVRVEGHTGVGYPLSQQVCVGTPTP